MKLKEPLLFRQQAYIDGAWCNADSGATFGVDNPATGEIIGNVPDMGAAETQRAIDAANAALPAWSNMSAKARGAILRKWFDLIMANADDLAQLMVLEQGKPFAEAKGEVAYGASFVEWFAEEGKRAYGDVIPTQSPDRRFVVIKQPIGVCAAITPWNFPIAMITRKCAPGLEDLLGDLWHARRSGDLGRLALLLYCEVRRWARQAGEQALAQEASALIVDGPSASREEYLALVDRMISELEAVHVRLV